MNATAKMCRPLHSFEKLFSHTPPPTHTQKLEFLDSPLVMFTDVAKQTCDTKLEVANKKFELIYIY